MQYFVRIFEKILLFSALIVNNISRTLICLKFLKIIILIYKTIVEKYIYEKKYLEINYGNFNFVIVTKYSCQPNSK